MSQLLTDLNACVEIIGVRSRWVQGCSYADVDGQTAYCSTGVVDYATARQRRIDVIEALYDALPQRVKTQAPLAVSDKRDRIEYYNDERQYHSVMKVWRRAIAIEQAKVLAQQRWACETELVVAGD